MSFRCLSHSLEADDKQNVLKCCLSAAFCPSLEADNKQYVLKHQSLTVYPDQRLRACCSIRPVLKLTITGCLKTLLAAYGLSSSQ